MKPRITFVAGSDVLSTNNREFHELPPINQELDFRGERYKVVGYREATVELELVPEAPEAPQRKARNSAKAKRTAKRQAQVAAKSKKASKTTGDGKSAATAVRGKFYNSRSN